MSKHPFELIGVLALVAIVVPGLLHAGEIQVGGQGGTGSPPGDLCEQQGEDCNIEVDLQPDQVCDYVHEPPGIVEENEYTDVDTLVTCMLNEQDRITGSFDSDPLPGGTEGPWGGEYYRVITLPGFPPLTFEVEIDRLEYNEDDPGIQTIQVTVDQGGLVARIAEITEGPDTVGGIVVQLDDDTEQGEANDDWECIVDLDAVADNLLTALDFNVALSQELRSSNGCDLDVAVDVFEGESFFVITHPDGLRRVQFNSTNDGVVKSGVALLPPDDPELEHLEL